MKSFCLGVLLIVAAVHVLPAQNPDRAARLYYNEEYPEAMQAYKSAFEADNRNGTALYWYVQCCVLNKELNAAQAMVAKHRASLANDPHVAAADATLLLLANKVPEARKAFEKALALCKGNKAMEKEIVLAMGRAYSHRLVVYATNPQYKPAAGEIIISTPDFNYVLGLLKALVAGPGVDAESYIVLGDFLKYSSGNDNPISYYFQATQLQDFQARSYYRYGRRSGVTGMKEVMEDYLKKAVAADPQYAPACMALYDFYSFEKANLAEAEKYLLLYLKNTTPSCSRSMLYPLLLQRYAKFDRAVEKLKELAKSLCKDDATVSKLLANNYIMLHDSLQAKQYIDDYLKTAMPAKVTAYDYSLAGKIYGTIDGQQAAASRYFEQSLNMDTSVVGKLATTLLAIAIWEKGKNYKEAAPWYDRLLALKQNPGKTDYFKAGTTYYYAGQFGKGGATFKTYAEKYGDDWRGPLWQARCAVQQDSLMQAGAAASFYEKYVSLGGADPANNKSTVEAYLYLFAVAYNMKKDKALAVGYLDKALALDPQNANALKYKGMLQ